jgi:hypothetical protein
MSARGRDSGTREATPTAKSKSEDIPDGLVRAINPTKIIVHTDSLA